MDSVLLENKAVKAAMNGAWDLAVQVNQQILAASPNNVSALSRLARAYWEKGRLSQAKQSYQKVLAIDPYNPIAKKNLSRLADQKQAAQKTNPQSTGSSIFIEEPGKTKSVKLVRLASPEVLSQVDSGDEVNLVPKERLISVMATEKTYLGTLPEDLSRQLLRLIKGGNCYQAFIKIVDRQTLEIFIRETKRAEQFKNQPSFNPALTFTNRHRRK